MGKTKVVCFSNNKGGSGKSTTCSNVGYALARAGKKVLLIDGDMQMNLTLSFFPEDAALAFAKGDKNLYVAMKDGKDLTDFIVKTSYENLDIVPSSTLMSGIEVELFTKWQREKILANALTKVVENGYYDIVLIDAPPTLGGWVMNIMVASDFVVIPVEASPWGLFGLANMFDFVGQVKGVKPSLEILGIAITKADERKKYFKETKETLATLPDVRLFKHVIRVDSAVEWAQDNSTPVVAFRPNSRSAIEYTYLAKEIMEYADR